MPAMTPMMPQTIALPPRAPVLLAPAQAPVVPGMPVTINGAHVAGVGGLTPGQVVRGALAPSGLYPDLMDTPGFTEQALRVTESITNKAMLGTMVLPLAGMVTGLVAAGGKKLGAATNSPVLQKTGHVIAGAGELGSLPGEIVSAEEVRRFSSNAMNAAGGFVERNFGKGNVSEGLQRRAGHVAAWEERTGNRVQRGFDWLAERMPKGEHNIFRWFAKRREMQVASEHGQLGVLLGRLEDTLKAQGGKVTGAHEISGHITEIKNALGKARDVAAKDGFTALGQAHVALGAIGTKIEGLERTHGDAGKETKQAIKALKKATKQCSGGFERLMGKFEALHFWSKPGEAVARMPGRIGSSSLSHAAFTTSLAAGIGYQGINLVRNLRSQMHTLERLCAEIEGKKKIPFGYGWHVMFGDVPAPIAQARAEIRNEFGPRAIVQALSAFFNIKLLRGGSGLLANLGMVGTDMVAGAFIPQGKLTAMCQEIDKALALRQPVPDQAYAALLCAASPDIEACGAQSPLVRAVAESYAKEQLSVAGVFKEITSGKINARGKKAQEALASAQTPDPRAQVVQAEQATQHKALDAAVAKGHPKGDVPSTAIKGAERAGRVIEPQRNATVT